MSSKTKKGGTSWVKCENCNSNMLQKDSEVHLSNCPPSSSEFTHPYVLNKVLHSTLGIKSNEEIKGISAHDKNNMVFLSQSAIQLCDLVIGDWAIIENENQKSLARIVWPTAEKSVSSVLITQSDYDLNWFNHLNKPVHITKLNTQNIKIAQKVTLISLNVPKSLNFTPELTLRLKKLHQNRIVLQNNCIEIFFYGKILKFKIKEIISSSQNQISESPNFSSLIKNLETEFSEKLQINPELHFCQINETTTFHFCSSTSTDSELQNDSINDYLDQIGRLESEVSELNDLVKLALGQIKKISGAKTVRGILLYGSSGTGKTMTATAVANSMGCNVVKINGADIYSKNSTEVETVIKNFFSEAIESAPSLILLDEIDILCPIRSSRITDLEKRVVSTILGQFDELASIKHSKICILATSSRPDFIDPAFRRPGRLDREIEIPIPNPLSRLKILQKLFSKIQNSISPEQLKEISNAAYGFVGSDLQSLVTTSEINAIKRNSDKIEFKDLKFALTRVRPSAMKEVQIEVPNVKWTDIGGQDKLKLILKQAVQWPLKHPESFIRMGITPPKGILMFGPPGCSKTMIAKALATESGLNFLSIKGPELFSKWVGESERAVREVFRKARQVAPSIVFFDEIDALGSERSSGGNNSGGTNVQERVLAQLLTELDGVTPLGDVTILAATNRPDRIDKALLRPGRLDRIVYVPLPDQETRKEIFKIKLNKMPVQNVDLDYLVERSKNYSGAEIQAVCHEAAMKALETDINAEFVTLEHFNEAFNMVTPRTPDSLLKIYKEYI